MGGWLDLYRNGYPISLAAVQLGLGFLSTFPLFSLLVQIPVLVVKLHVHSAFVSHLLLAMMIGMCCSYVLWFCFQETNCFALKSQRLASIAASTSLTTPFQQHYIYFLAIIPSSALSCLCLGLLASKWDVFTSNSHDASYPIVLYILAGCLAATTTLSMNLSKMLFAPYFGPHNRIFFAIGSYIASLLAASLIIAQSVHVARITTHGPRISISDMFWINFGIATACNVTFFFIFMIMLAQAHGSGLVLSFSSTNSSKPTQASPQFASKPINSSLFNHSSESTFPTPIANAEKSPHRGFKRFFAFPSQHLHFQRSRQESFRIIHSPKLDINPHEDLKSTSAPKPLHFSTSAQVSPLCLAPGSPFHQFRSRDCFIPYDRVYTQPRPHTIDKYPSQSCSSSEYDSTIWTIPPQFLVAVRDITPSFHFNKRLARHFRRQKYIFQQYQIDQQDKVYRAMVEYHLDQLERQYQRLQQAKLLNRQLAKNYPRSISNSDPNMAIINYNTDVVFADPLLLTDHCILPHNHNFYDASNSEQCLAFSYSNVYAYNDNEPFNLHCYDVFRDGIDLSEPLPPRDVVSAMHQFDTVYDLHALTDFQETMWPQYWHHFRDNVSNQVTNYLVKNYASRDCSFAWCCDYFNLQRQVIDIKDHLNHTITTMTKRPLARNGLGQVSHYCKTTPNLVPSQLKAQSLHLHNMDSSYDQDDEKDQREISHFVHNQHFKNRKPLDPIEQRHFSAIHPAKPPCVISETHLHPLHNHPHHTTSSSPHVDSSIREEHLSSPPNSLLPSTTAASSIPTAYSRDENREFSVLIDVNSIAESSRNPSPFTEISSSSHTPSFTTSSSPPSLFSPHSTSFHPQTHARVVMTSPKITRQRSHHHHYPNTSFHRPQSTEHTVINISASSRSISPHSMRFTQLPQPNKSPLSSSSHINHHEVDANHAYAWLATHHNWPVYLNPANYDEPNDDHDGFDDDLQNAYNYGDVHNIDINSHLDLAPTSILQRHCSGQFDSSPRHNNVMPNPPQIHPNTSKPMQTFAPQPKSIPEQLDRFYSHNYAMPTGPNTTQFTTFNPFTMLEWYGAYCRANPDLPCGSPLPTPPKEYIFPHCFGFPPKNPTCAPSQEPKQHVRLVTADTTDIHYQPALAPSEETKWIDPIIKELLNAPLYFPTDSFSFPGPSFSFLFHSWSPQTYFPNTYAAIYANHPCVRPDAILNMLQKPIISNYCAMERYIDQYRRFCAEMWNLRLNHKTASPFADYTTRSDQLFSSNHTLPSSSYLQHLASTSYTTTKEPEDALDQLLEPPEQTPFITNSELITASPDPFADPTQWSDLHSPIILYCPPQMYIFVEYCPLFLLLYGSCAGVYIVLLSLLPYWCFHQISTSIDDGVQVLAYALVVGFVLYPIGSLWAAFAAVLTQKLAPSISSSNRITALFYCFVIVPPVLLGIAIFWLYMFIIAFSTIMSATHRAYWYGVLICASVAALSLVFTASHGTINALLHSMIAPLGSKFIEPWYRWADERSISRLDGNLRNHSTIADPIRHKVPTSPPRPTVELLSLSSPSNTMSTTLVTSPSPPEYPLREWLKQYGGGLAPSSSLQSPSSITSTQSSQLDPTSVPSESSSTQSIHSPPRELVYGSTYPIKGVDKTNDQDDSIIEIPSHYHVGSSPDRSWHQIHPNPMDSTGYSYMFHHKPTLHPLDEMKPLPNPLPHSTHHCLVDNDDNDDNNNPLVDWNSIQYTPDGGAFSPTHVHRHRHSTLELQNKGHNNAKNYTSSQPYGLNCAHRSIDGQLQMMLPRWADASIVFSKIWTIALEGCLVCCLGVAIVVMVLNQFVKWIDDPLSGINPVQW